MDELRARVARKKAAGLYSVDALAGHTTRPNAPFNWEGLAELEPLASVTPSFEIYPSTKPVIGPAVSRGKAAISRATRHPVIDLSARTTAFNEALVHYIASLAQEVAALRAEVDRLTSDGKETSEEAPSDR